MKIATFPLFWTLLFIPWVFAQDKNALPPFVHNSGLVVHHKETSTLYASFWLYGVYKSTDYGKTWRPINRGFKNASVYTLKMDPKDPNTLFAGTHAGGIYKTADGGENWMEVNTGLTTSTIWDLVFDPGNSNDLYALTTAGLFKSNDGGQRWSQLSGGIPGPTPDQQMTLFTIPSFDNRRSSILLQNGGLIFRWLGTSSSSDRSSNAWSPPILKDVTRIRATPLASDIKSGMVYTGTQNGLLKSTDGGVTWRLATSEIKNANWIVLDPALPDTLYIGTDGNGIFKSLDGGKTVRPINNGLLGPTSQRIFGLAIDPKDGRRLYAASHSIGLFRTEDGGEHWNKPEIFPIPTIAEVAALTRRAIEASKTRLLTVPPPSDFMIHCNKCHGWTDPNLDNNRDAPWRAAPTRRDWTVTVQRMGQLAGLKDQQKAVITNYLNKYYGPGKE